MVQKEFKTGIYNSDVIVVVCDSFDEIQTVIDLSEASDYDGICFRGDNSTYCIAFISSEFTFAKLSHEIVHLVNMIFVDHGVELDLRNDEHQAYFHEFLFKQVEEFINSLPEFRHV